MKNGSFCFCSVHPGLRVPPPSLRATAPSPTWHRRRCLLVPREGLSPPPSFGISSDTFFPPARRLAGSSPPPPPHSPAGSSENRRPSFFPVFLPSPRRSPLESRCLPTHLSPGAAGRAHRAARSPVWSPWPRWARRRPAAAPILRGRLHRPA
uniref:Uncharacterized protein n=1 Tax=Setaria viridis TaxID=4556 RepID=A0A4U6VEY6_SETVI|nr:hypothetical protein SEVIR_3G247400v2 [Setaria viridis]